jgi:hypothetical protein
MVRVGPGRVDSLHERMRALKIQVMLLEADPMDELLRVRSPMG